MSITYDPNKKSTFNGYIIKAISNLKKAETETGGLQKCKMPSKTIIGRRFNKNIVIGQCKKSIKTSYQSLSSVQSDVEGQVKKYELANLKVTGYVDEYGNSTLKIGQKKKWDEMSDLEKMLERGSMEFAAGFFGGAEKLGDGILTHAGAFADAIGWEEAGTWCAKKVKSDYWGTWRQEQIELRGMGDDFAGFGEFMYNAGGTSFDFAVTATLTAVGAPAAAGVAYTYLKDTGDTARDLYKSNKINVNNINDRKNVNAGAIMVGAVNGLMDYGAGKLVGGMPAKSLHSAVIKKGGISATAGTFKTLFKESVKSSVTGEKMNIDIKSIASDAFLTFMISGTEGGLNYKKEHLTDNIKPKTKRGQETIEEAISQFSDEDTESYSDNAKRLRDEASKTKSKTKSKGYNKIADKAEIVADSEKKMKTAKTAKEGRKARNEYSKAVNNYIGAIEEYSKPKAEKISKQIKTFKTASKYLKKTAKNKTKEFLNYIDSKDPIEKAKNYIKKNKNLAK